jgi:hypothetical protein
MITAEDAESAESLLRAGGRTIDQQYSLTAILFNSSAFSASSAVEKSD